MWQAEPNVRGERGLDRYRGYGRFYERYWSRLFSMTQADMARFAERMRVERHALDLTTLAKDTIRARLRGGPELNSGPAPNGSMPAHVVRLWDPGAMWRVGDRAIMAVPATVPGRHFVPAVGEVRQVGDDHVIIQIDGIPAPQVYALGMQNHAHYRHELRAGDVEQPLLTQEIVSLADRQDELSQTDYVLWRFGSSVVGRLLHALQADAGFLELEGLWYRADLTQPLREGQLVALAQSMFASPSRPRMTLEVLALMSPGAEPSEGEQFGALLSLQERPDLFKNMGSVSHPRWMLAGPPPVRLVANYSVYDPETYMVLCTPGEVLSPQAAQRLWDVGLLQAALGEPVEPASSVPVADDRPVNSPPASDPELGFTTRTESPRRQSWRRWLPFQGND